MSSANLINQARLVARSYVFNLMVRDFLYLRVSVTIHQADTYASRQEQKFALWRNKKVKKLKRLRKLMNLK